MNKINDNLYMEHKTGVFAEPEAHSLYIIHVGSKVCGVYVSVCVGGGLHFSIVRASAFCIACSCLICFWGNPDRRPLQCSSFNKIGRTYLAASVLVLSSIL